MSAGCGTLEKAPGVAFDKGPRARRKAEQGGKPGTSNTQRIHSLPANPQHELITREQVDEYWDAKQTKGPSRLWGTAKPTKYGGEERPLGEPEGWIHGDYWNVDSNVRRWGLHEVRRNAAAANHDVHRNDQVTRVLVSHEETKYSPEHGCTMTTERPARQCTSGVITTTENFLEAWGFDLGRRDRLAQKAPVWHPVNSGQQFRHPHTYNRNKERICENFRSMRRTQSTPNHSRNNMSAAFKTQLLKEDVGGQIGEFSTSSDFDHEKAGRTFASRSCNWWDNHGHTTKREAAKQGCGIHSPVFKSHGDNYPYHDNCELSPAAIYTRRFKKFGESGLRTHEPRNKDHKPPAMGQTA